MNEDNKISIGERIYQLRRDSGKSQGELADMLGVSRQSVSKWETGASNPEIENLIEISKIFGVSTDDIINHTQNSDDENIPISACYKGENQSKKIGAILLACGGVVVLIGLFINIILLIIGGITAIVGLFMLTFKKGEPIFNSWIAYGVLYVCLCWFGTGTLYGFVGLMITIGLSGMMSSMPAQTIIGISLSAVFTILAVITIAKGEGLQGKIDGILFVLFGYCISIILASITSFFTGFFVATWLNVLVYGGYIAMYLYFVKTDKIKTNGRFILLCYASLIFIYTIGISVIMTITLEQSLSAMFQNPYAITHNLSNLVFAIFFGLLAWKMQKDIK